MEHKLSPLEAVGFITVEERTILPGMTAPAPHLQLTYRLLLVRQGALCVLNAADGAGAGGPRVRRAARAELLRGADTPIADRVVRAGRVALLRPGRWTALQSVSDEPTEIVRLLVRHPPLPAADVAALDAAPLSLPVSAAMGHFIAAALALGPRGNACRLALVGAVGGALALYLAEARAAGLLTGNTAPHPAVAAAQRYLEAHLQDPVRLTDLAAVAHVSPEYLIHLFHRECGLSPMRYLWAERLRTGVQLLQHSTLPVFEVAERAGFKSAEHFSKRVRAATGKSPRQLRQKRSVISGRGPSALTQ